MDWFLRSIMGWVGTLSWIFRLGMTVSDLMLILSLSLGTLLESSIWWIDLSERWKIVSLLRSWSMVFLSVGWFSILRGSCRDGWLAYFASKLWIRSSVARLSCDCLLLVIWLSWLSPRCILWKGTRFTETCLAPCFSLTFYINREYSYWISACLWYE